MVVSLLLCVHLFLCIEHSSMQSHPTGSTQMNLSFNENMSMDSQRNMFIDDHTSKASFNQTNPSAEDPDDIRNDERGKKQNSTFNTIMKTHSKNEISHFGNSSVESASAVSITSILPKYWQTFCTAEFKFVSGAGLNFTGQWAVYVSCDLGKDGYWSLSEYRKWISTNEETIYNLIPTNSGLLFAFDFKCHDKEAILSIPWPIQGQYLWYVSVNNCTLHDYLLEFKITHHTKYYLKVLEVIDSVQETDESIFFEFFQNPEKQSRNFYCTGEELERFVFRNVKKSFIGLHMETDVKINRLKSQMKVSKLRNSDDLKRMSGAPHGMTFPTRTGVTPVTVPPKPDSKKALNESQMVEAIAKHFQDQQKVKYQCNYASCRYIDESYSHSVAKHQSHVMTEKSQWPALEYFNMSHSGLIWLPSHYLEWRRYFPKMKYMDLSHNRIKHFSTLNDNGKYSDNKGILDLRHNNITTLTLADLQVLRLQSRSVFLDIRDNPFQCDCKMTQFVVNAKNSSFETFHIYKYLKNLTCSSPAQHAGKTIALLENNFCQTMEVVLLTVPLVIVCCFTVLVIAIFILSIRYRKEIVILAFTRLNISLPCRQIMKNGDKKYDAFIAYSEEDADWVFQTLLLRLEEPIENNGPGLKLCIHHRDFPVGGCIADNILDKVKDSRHTVLILSNNFLQSHWCKYEFKAAFTQSIVEKKQHLIMIIKEELDKLLIDQALKRCLKTFTFLKADDRLFWDKVVYALSDKEKKRDRNIVDEDGIENAVARNGNRDVVDNHFDNINDGVWVVNEGLNIPNVQGNNAERVMYQHHDNINQNGQNVQDGVWNI